MVFVAFLDNFAQFPILASLATELGAGAFLAGAVIGAYSLTNLAGNLAVGPILDRRGAAGPLAWSLGATAAVLALYPLATDAGTLVVLRLLHGAAAAAIVPACFAAAARLGTVSATPIGRMGTLGAMIGVAAVVGPPLSGAVAGRGGYAAVYLSLAVLFAAMALAIRFLPGLDRGAVDGGSESRVPDRRPARTVLAEATGSGLVLVWLGGGVLVFAVGAVALVLPLQVAGPEGAADPREAGRLLGAFSLAAVLVMAGLARIRRTLSPARTLQLAGAGIAVLASGLGLLGGLAPGPPGPLRLAWLGIGFGLAFPTLAASVSLRTVPARVGTAFAWFYAAYSAGALLGPVAAGIAVPIGTGPEAGYLPAVAVAAGTGTLLLARGIREAAREAPPPRGGG